MILEPEEEVDLREAIGKFPIIKIAASADSPIYINYDHKLAGEAATNPKQRIPPFKYPHATKCLRAWMAHRGGCQPTDPLDIADEYVMTDGGKPGLYKELLKVFKDKQHDVRHVTMMYLRDDVHSRREKTKAGSVNQIEGQLHITQAISDKPVRVGTHYRASSDGNAIGMIRLPAYGAKDALMVTPAMKAKLFGKRRWDVGGLGRVEADSLPEPKKVRWADNDEDLEPAFFHSPDFKFFDDEIVTSGATAVIDFTPGAGYLLWAAVVRNVPALGVCMTELHQELVHTHMLSMCLQAMCEEGHDLYDPRFVEVLGQHGETAAAAAIAAAAKAAAAGLTGKGKGKGKGKGRAKAKGKAAAKAKASEEDEAEDEQEGSAPESELDETEGGAEAGSAAATPAKKSTMVATPSPAEAKLLGKMKALGSSSPSAA